ncbi:non-oxidative hydroxyarylic acid decarboxylases subunit C [Fodinicola feengrottensis]|uniref:Non-oxidative hydroxyarylic acid decarboxylases subunit C n=1 Tax=Fodinicola feengrottensis TaxID=435914 RepID=A0ABN2HQ99_9ACTN|nr:non-oxidative hydroxyarylic acid decarboxylases subunit C [Fodinicola feengrottensis]
MERTRLMAYDDLRAFLAELDKNGQLLSISEEVTAEPDLAAAANAVSRVEGSPALYFDNVQGFRDAKIALNVHGSWPNHALALGLPPDTLVREQVEEFARRWENFPVPPVRRVSPPWAENTRTGDEVNIFDVLPVFRLNDGDSGFFLDKAAVVSRDPTDPGNFGKQNVGIYRLEVKGPRRLGLQPAPMHDIAIHLQRAEESHEDLPIAIAVGNDPAITLAAATPMAYDQSEYELAGALRGEPAPIATAPLTGLDVPWGSEVVLEGVVEGRKRELEGPFGEFTGHYSGGRKMPVVRVDRISYRTNPIYESLYLGMPWTELDYLIGPATCVQLYQQLKADFPEVQAVNAMYTHGLLAIISTKTRYGGFAKAVGMRAMTTPHGLGYCKMVIVVDAEVDPFDLPRVMWAMSTKVNAAADLVNLPNLSVLHLDPSSEPAGISNKLIIDATTPVPPDRRGRFEQAVHDLPETGDWVRRLQAVRKGKP